MDTTDAILGLEQPVKDRSCIGKVVFQPLHADPDRFDGPGPRRRAQVQCHAASVGGPDQAEVIGG